MQEAIDLCQVAGEVYFLSVLNVHANVKYFIF